ncbi:MAG: hypothetical protein U0350_44550 [Caldilineaceae bacterium]
MRVVHYERDGTLIGYHKEPAVPTGRTAEELAQDIEWFKQAFELPILTLEELDAELAARPPKQKQPRRKNKTLEQLMAELEQDAASNLAEVPSAHEPVGMD